MKTLKKLIFLLLKILLLGLLALLAGVTIFGLVIGIFTKDHTNSLSPFDQKQIAISYPWTNSADPSLFTQAQDQKVFRLAQMHYFEKLGLDHETGLYEYPSPRPDTWGSLPYPPIKNAPKNTSRSSLEFDPEYEQELDRLTGHELTRGNKITLYQNGTSKPPIAELIAHAEHFIFVNMLSLACDEDTLPIIASLEEKARAGLDVRLLINRGFSVVAGDCLKRMKNAGISVLKSETHSSYLVSDQKDLVIGSENLARMFFRSDGYNFQDRDLMLQIHGPLATDALGDFLSVWEEARTANDPGIETYVPDYKRRRAQEIADQLRGHSTYKSWKHENGLCRFATQKPSKRDTSISDLLISLISRAKERVKLSAVRLGHSDVMAAAENAAKKGLKIDYLGNGPDGKNGELTIALREISKNLIDTGYPRTARVVNWVSEKDGNAEVRRNLKNYALLSPLIAIWEYFNFLHYKAVQVDEGGVWVGSPNLDQASFEKSYESGVFCVDDKLSQEFSDQYELDLMNSVPYRH